VFRFRVLPKLVGVLLLLSIVFSLGHRFSFLETALTILVAQTIFQGTYFTGLIARSFFYGTDEGRDPAFLPPRDLPATGTTSRFLTLRVKLPVGGFGSLKALSNIRHISSDGKFIPSILQDKHIPAGRKRKIRFLRLHQ
jgi:hypothetical protein